MLAQEVSTCLPPTKQPDQVTGPQSQRDGRVISLSQGKMAEIVKCILVVGTGGCIIAIVRWKTDPVIWPRRGRRRRYQPDSLVKSLCSNRICLKSLTEFPCRRGRPIERAMRCMKKVPEDLSLPGRC